MVNTSLFTTVAGKLLPWADSVNHEGAPAYEMTPRHKLAQYAVTGCLNSTFYASAREQLEVVLDLVENVDPEFIAKTAIYCREKGMMRDMPALLVAALASKGPEYLPVAFDRVINNGKMLRNFVQIMRSGTTGRKSLGSRPKRLVQNWLNRATDMQLVRASVGNTPSLADVIKMVHPKPKDKAREALFAWLIDREHDAALLPEVIREFEDWKQDRTGKLPDVPFQMLTALELAAEDWAQIARNGGWQMLRMNLNSFAPHGVFAIDGMAEEIAARLSDAAEIRKAQVFPYQLMVAYTMAGEEVPEVVREALREALEISLGNVPVLRGNVVICPDVSGSMSSPVTGYRRGATTAVKCVDVAALVAAACLAKNRDARVLAFDHNVVDYRPDPEAGVMENAARLAEFCGGGTNCSAPLQMLNRERADVDLVIFVSDNESWVDNIRYRDTGMLREWSKLKARNPEARLVCLDIQPYGTSQAKEREDILNIGGFSDNVFEIISAFATGELDAGHWVGTIEKTEL